MPDEEIEVFAVEAYENPVGDRVEPTETFLCLDVAGCHTRASGGWIADMDARRRNRRLAAVDG